MELHAAYISSLFFYRFVIEDVAPNVGYYTITDYIYMLVMVNMIIVFLFGLFMTLIAKYGEKMGFWSEFTRENLFLWLQVVTVFVVFFVVRWKPY